MDTHPIILVHLDEKIGGVVRDRHWVVFIEIDTNDVAIPCHASSEIVRIEVYLGLARVPLESIISAMAEILRPCHTSCHNYIISTKDKHRDIKKKNKIL